MKIIALGNEAAGDDGAALLAVKQVQAKLPIEPELNIIFAGRPGPELLDLLDGEEAVILVDVVTGAGSPGQVITLALDELIDKVSVGRQVSSHGFGPAEVLQLGQALGRALPRGRFIGIEGERFAPGEVLSTAVQSGMDEFVGCVQAAIEAFTTQ